MAGRLREPRDAQEGVEEEGEGQREDYLQEAEEGEGERARVVADVEPDEEDRGDDHVEVRLIDERRPEDATGYTWEVAQCRDAVQVADAVHAEEERESRLPVN